MEGLYLYSFALNPEKNNPSGYYNASLVDSKISIYINNYQHNDPLFNLDNLDNLKRILKNEESHKIQNYFVDIYPKIIYKKDLKFGSTKRTLFSR